MIRQETWILNHLKTKGSITPIEALEKYQCFRLAARISDLREQGYKIDTEIERRGGKRWARYSLVTPERGYAVNHGNIVW